MKSHKLPRAGRAALLAGCVLVGMAAMTPDAIAQNKPVSNRAIPPSPKRSEDPPVLWNYLFAVILGAGVVAATMIPSKRGHQD